MNLKELLAKDNYKAIRLETALPFIERVLHAYLGSFQIVPGSSAYTDGETITLPRKYSDFADDRKDLTKNRNVSAYMSLGIHELLHIREESFEFNLKEYLEKYSYPAFARTVLNIIEDSRIEHNARSYLRSDHMGLIDGLNRHLSMKPPQTDDIAQNFMNSYMDKVICGYDWSSVNPEVRSLETSILSTEVSSDVLLQKGFATFGDVRDRLEELALSAHGKRVQYSWAALPESYQLLSELLPGYPERVQEQESLHFIFELVDDWEQGRPLSEAVGILIAALPDGTSILPIPSSAPHQGNLILQENPKTVPPTSKKQQINYKYKGEVTRGTVQFKDFNGSNEQIYSLLAKHAQTEHQILSYYQELRPTIFSRLITGTDIDDLDMDVVIEALSDPSMRSDAPIYENFELHTRDAYTAILIDQSGSTSWRPESTYPLSVLDVEKISAAIMSRSLREIGEEVDVFSFYSGKHTTIHVLQTLQQLGAIAPASANHDGDAIRAIGERMEDIVARDKRLIVLSDGQPNARSYTGFRAIEDTARAFLSVEQRGIETVYFNVDLSAPEYFDVLTRYCSFARSIPSVDALPEAVGEYVMSIM